MSGGKRYWNRETPLFVLKLLNSCCRLCFYGVPGTEYSVLVLLPGTSTSTPYVFRT